MNCRNIPSSTSNLHWFSPSKNAPSEFSPSPANVTPLRVEMILSDSSYVSLQRTDVECPSPMNSISTVSNVSTPNSIELRNTMAAIIVPLLNDPSQNKPININRNLGSTSTSNFDLSNTQHKTEEIEEIVYNSNKRAFTER